MLQWFPFLDLVGNRLPNRFIRPSSRNTRRLVAEIEDLAHGLGDRDALVIFPEGGNFTERRRISSIGNCSIAVRRNVPRRPAISRTSSRRTPVV